MITFADINSFDLSSEISEVAEIIPAEDPLLQIREENRVWEEALCLLYA